MEQSRDVKTDTPQSADQPFVSSIIVKHTKTSMDWTHLQDKLPSIVWRHRWNDLAEKHGLPFKRSYMQNLDSEGRGPEKVYLHGRVGYPTHHLVKWLNSL